MSAFNDIKEIDSASEIANEEQTEKIDEIKAKKSRPKILQRYRRESEINLKKPDDSDQDSFRDKSALSIDIETQTEWSWLQDMQIIERIRKEGADLLGEILHDMAQTDSEESDNETQVDTKPSPEPAPMVEAIGPPKILQYQPETKKPDPPPAPPSTIYSVESEPIEDLGSFMRDFNVHIKGGQPCEFCGVTTKPWPSILDQEVTSPEQLHCCNDYQEYVDALIQYQLERAKIRNGEVDLDKQNSKNKQKNAKARKLAEERAELRNMQRLMEKEKRMERLANQKLEKQQQLAQLQASRQIQAANRVAHDPISNQIRSINYQLSNYKYIQDGWTVRPKSSLDFDEFRADDEFEINLTAQLTGQTLIDKNLERPLVLRKYKNDSTCLILFPDGSGNVFYPSGRIALSIVQLSPGMHVVNAFTDDEANPSLMASFDPYGNGCVNFLNGKLRLLLSPWGGVELNSEGLKKKRWSWWNMDEHVHAPPFQPIIFALNNNLSVKVYSHDKINVNFFAESQICKFRVGSKIKLNRPELLPLSLKFDSNEIFLKKKRNRIEELFRLMHEDTTSNMLKLPRIAANSKSAVTPRSKLNYDIFKLTQDRKDSYKKSARKGSSKFISVP